jgi:hypothetical protein
VSILVTIVVATLYTALEGKTTRPSLKGVFGGYTPTLTLTLTCNFFVLISWFVT